MKKIVLITLLAFLLAGCATASAKVTDGDEVIWKSNEKTFTKQDLNDYLKAQDYSYMLIQPILTKLGELEEIDTESYRQEAEDQWQQIVDQGMEEYYTSYYGDKDYIVNTTIINGIYTDLLEKYVTENYDKYKEEQHPYKAQVAYFDDLNTVNSIIKEVNDGAHTFEYAVQEYEYNGDLTEKVYTDASELPVEVKEAVLNSDATGLLDTIQTSTYINDAEGNSTITPRYYLVYVTSRDVDSFKDEFVEFVASEIIDPQDTLATYMNKYNLKFYDQRSFELMKQTYGEFK